MKNSSDLKNNEFRINYIYFGFIFLFILALHVFHICFIDIGSLSTKMRFIIDAAIQCTIEIMAFVFLDCFIRRYLHKSISYVFITLTFFIFLAHLADFFIIRLMGMSVWTALDLFLDETFANFIEMLRASNITFFSWILAGCITILVFSMGVVFFHLTEKWLKRWHLYFSPRLFSLILFSFPLSLAFFDKIAIQKESYANYDTFTRLLPWKMTFFSPEETHLSFALKPAKDEDEVKKNISFLPKNLSKKPPIYLFIIESLRADFITEEIAPHLSKFKKDNISFETAISGANATQVSWFSLFHSKLPLKWTKHYPAEWNMGSPALYALKHLGYKIHVYTSAELAYYHMDKLIFGKDKSLADSISYFPYGGTIKAHESDTKAVEKLCADIALHDKEEGHVYITFLDSTHFDYSWPKTTPDRFTPIQDNIDFLNVCYNKSNLHLIKNRYRNSIYFIDSLIGKFLQTETRNDAIIAITGDHGEEFYEHGHIFHTSSLSREQTEVPLYYKLGTKTLTKTPQVSSHLDIFPTILHHLVEDKASIDFLEGQSILEESYLPFAICAKYNAGRNPFEFFVHNGKEKLLCKFSNNRSIFHSKSLHLITLKNRFEEELKAKDLTNQMGFLEVFKRIAKES